MWNNRDLHTYFSKNKSKFRETDFFFNWTFKSTFMKIPHFCHFFTKPSVLTRNNPLLIVVRDSILWPTCKMRTKAKNEYNPKRIWHSDYYAALRCAHEFLTFVHDKVWHENAVLFPKIGKINFLFCKFFVKFSWTICVQFFSTLTKWKIKCCQYSPSKVFWMTYWGWIYPQKWCVYVNWAKY